MEQNQFRIGGVYRQYGGGYVVRLDKSVSEGMALAVVLAADGSPVESNGERCLSDGTSVVMAGIGDHGNGCDLIPGELTLVNGEWVGFDSKREEEKCAFDFDKAHAAILSTIAAAPEPKRPPLDWADDTPFDPFADFIVTSGTQAQEQSKSTGFPAWRADTAASHLLGQFSTKEQ